MATPVETLAEDELKLALLAHVRQDFSAPVAAIVGYAEILLEDAPRSGLRQLVPDLERMLESGRALQRLVEELLEPAFLARRAEGTDYEGLRSVLRHDLRTPLNAIQGYGEMLLEDAEDVRADIFVHDLRKLLEAARRLIARIDDLVAFASSDDNEGAVRGESPATAPLIGALRRIIRPAEEDAAAMSAGGCRILVVDDHESNRDLLSRRLRRAGHEVVAAAKGREALERVEGEAFDLILLDLLMPDMSGYEVLVRLKGDQRHRDIPVIMISALDQIDSVARCIESGAEDYLPKPFNPVLLRARINASMEKKRLRDREKVIMRQLRIEKEKSDALLRNILPVPIVSRLNLGETVIADHVDDATILFADLVGFTGLSARLSPAALVDLLNSLFSDFDRLSDRFGVEKIKTIGDAYMVAGGLLAPDTDHVEMIADMALAMVAASRRASGRLGLPLPIRIGIHTGPVVAGIIGTHKFIYDVWGDTVNTASRMESHGAPDEVNVSEASWRRLRGSFDLEPRGTIELAGRGPMNAYFLRGRREKAQRDTAGTRLKAADFE